MWHLKRNLGINCREQIDGYWREGGQGMASTGYGY